MSTSYKILAVILGILMIIAGFYCLFAPGLTFLVLGWIIGIGMVADAIGNIFTWKGRKDAGLADGLTLAGAIVSLIFGILLLGSNLLQLSVDLFVANMAAAWVVIIGILRMVRAFELRKFRDAPNMQNTAGLWWVAMINGILLIIIGLIGLMNPIITAIAIGTLMGLEIVFAGINLISTAWAL